MKELLSIISELMKLFPMPKPREPVQQRKEHSASFEKVAENWRRLTDEACRLRAENAEAPKLRRENEFLRDRLVLYEREARANIGEVIELKSRQQQLSAPKPVTAEIKREADALQKTLNTAEATPEAKMAAVRRFDEINREYAMG